MFKTTTFLQVGPIAVTSANPTGEADTTHHNQVYAKLGKKVKTIFIIIKYKRPGYVILFSSKLHVLFAWLG